MGLLTLAANRVQMQWRGAAICRARWQGTQRRTGGPPVAPASAPANRGRMERAAGPQKNTPYARQPWEVPEQRNTAGPVRGTRPQQAQGSTEQQNTAGPRQNGLLQGNKGQTASKRHRH